MLKIDGVVVPTELLTKLEEEVEDPKERDAQVMAFVQTHEDYRPLSKSEAERSLHAPLMKLRDQLTERAAKARETKAAREAKNKELAAKNANTARARGTAPAAKPATTQDVAAPKGSVPGAKAQG